MPVSALQTPDDRWMIVMISSDPPTKLYHIPEGDMKFLLDSPNTRRMREMVAMGHSLAAARVNSERCIYSEQSQIGSTSFGGIDLVTTTGKTTPDEIEIDRGTCGRVAVVGCL